MSTPCGPDCSLLADNGLESLVFSNVRILYWLVPAGQPVLFVVIIITVMEYGSAWPAQFLKMPYYSSGKHHQTQLIHAPTCHIFNPIFKEWWNKVTYHTPNERRKYLKGTHSQITGQMFFLNANLICTLKTVSALLVRWPGIQKQPLSPREGRAILRHKMEGTILLLLLSVEVISG